MRNGYSELYTFTDSEMICFYGNIKMDRCTALLLTTKSLITTLVHLYMLSQKINCMKNKESTYHIMSCNKTA